MRVVLLDRPWKRHQPLKIFNFLISLLNIWKDCKVGPSCLQVMQKKFNLLLIRITDCIESCLSILAGALLFDEKIRQSAALFLVWIARWLNSLLTSLNPKKNWCLSRIFETRFPGKDHGLSTCKPWSERAGGWIHFCTKQLRTLNSYQIFKIKNIK
jgi:hypothetical protein